MIIISSTEVYTLIFVGQVNNLLEWIYPCHSYVAFDGKKNSDQYYIIVFIIFIENFSFLIYKNYWIIERL